MKGGLAIYNILSNDVDVSALVGARIFPNVARNKTQFPFIIYDVNSESPTDDKDGVSTLDVDGVMVSCYSKTYVEASDLAQKIRTALDRVKGTFGGVEIQSIQYIGYNDLFDDDSGDEGIYRKALDFRIRIINTIESVWANIYSLDFDGVDDYLSVGDSDVFTFGDGVTDNPFSFSCWAYQNIATSNAFMAKSNSSDKEYHFITDTSGKLRIRLYDDSTGKYIQSKMDNAITSGSWIHISFTYDGSSDEDGLNIYIDGALVPQTRSSNGTYNAMENTTAELNIGYSKQNASYINGNIDETTLFNIELSQSQITSIYNSGVPTDLSAHSGLIGYWRMGDPNGTSSYPTILDESTNSNNGTMTNMTSSDIVINTP